MLNEKLTRLLVRIDLAKRDVDHLRAKWDEYQAALEEAKLDLFRALAEDDTIRSAFDERWREARTLCDLNEAYETFMGV